MFQILLLRKAKSILETFSKFEQVYNLPELNEYIKKEEEENHANNNDDDKGDEEEEESLIMRKKWNTSHFHNNSNNNEEEKDYTNVINDYINFFHIFPDIFRNF